MHAWVSVAFYIQFVTFVTSFDWSNFRATNVLNDSCSRTDPLSVSVVRTKSVCAIECSQNVNCRRFMIRNQLNRVECSLYYEGENCATLQPTGCSCFMKTKSQYNGTMFCPIGLYGDNCENIIKDCSEGEKHGWIGFDTWVRSYIKPVGSNTAFEVTCEFRYGGYTTFMTRLIKCQDFSFNRNIAEYINGFGDAMSDHWLGLKRIKEILDNNQQNRLSVILMRNDTFCENYYNEFSIGSASNGYPIHLGKYQTWALHGCGDSLNGTVDIDGSPFSAPGSDQTSFNCADIRQGGWWYANDSRCSESYIMGSRDAMIWPRSPSSTPQNSVALRIHPYLPEE